MADKHDRFRRLEKAREESLPGKPVGVAQRFEKERPAARPAHDEPQPRPEPEPEADASAQRAEEQDVQREPEAAHEEGPDPELLAARLREERRKQTESGMQLDLERSEEEQPFLRCGKCEADSHKMAKRCLVCGERLDTDEQRAFNAAFWVKRRAESAKEAEEMEEIRKNLGGQSQYSRASSTRAYAEALAQGVGEREKERTAWMGGGEESRDLTPLGLRMLNKIQDPKKRLIVALVTLAVTVGLGYAAFSGPRQEGVSFSMLLFFVLMFMFLPSRRGGFFRNRW